MQVFIEQPALPVIGEQREHGNVKPELETSEAEAAQYARNIRSSMPHILRETHPLMEALQSPLLVCGRKSLVVDLGNRFEKEGCEHRATDTKRETFVTKRSSASLLNLDAQRLPTAEEVILIAESAFYRIMKFLRRF